MACGLRLRPRLGQKGTRLDALVEYVCAVVVVLADVPRHDLRWRKERRSGVSQSCFSQSTVN